MIGVNRAVNPSSIAAPAANYALGVLSEGPARLLHTAGIVPAGADGTVPLDLGAQADAVWASLGVILAEVGMSFTDVVSITTYVVVGNDLGTVMAARDRALNGHKVASTLITVPALARPEWQVEISLVAAT